MCYEQSPNLQKKLVPLGKPNSYFTQIFLDLFLVENHLYSLLSIRCSCSYQNALFLTEHGDKCPFSNSLCSCSVVYVSDRMVDIQCFYCIGAFVYTLASCGFQTASLYQIGGRGCRMG